MAEPTAVQRQVLAKLGYAMPDGSYYIRAGDAGASDLQNAIDAVGHGQDDPHNSIRVHVMKRAKDLGLSDKIPANWQEDGSLKHSNVPVDDFLAHYGVLGMTWGHHLPGVGDSNSPSPFIQPASLTQDEKPPEKQADDAINALQALHNKVAQAAEKASHEAESHDQQKPGQSQSPPSPLPHPAVKAPAKKPKLTKHQAIAVQTASKAHLAHVVSLVKKAKNAHAAHKAHVAKLAKHPNKTHAKAAIKAAHKKHASHVKHLLQIAHKSHIAHQAHITNIKKSVSHKVIAPHASHLNPKQKAAQQKAAEASAKKRHDAAAAREAANASPAAAKKQTAAAQAKRTPAQRAAVARLVANTKKVQMSQDDPDPVGTFLQHHGIKGMKWGVRKRSSPIGPSSEDHKHVIALKQKIKDAGGIHALSTEEIQRVTNRLAAEANYHRLNPQTGSLEKGRNFVKQVTSDTKTVLDAVDTGRRVVKLAQGTQSDNPGHQNSRTRNSPLKVVSVR